MGSKTRSTGNVCESRANGEHDGRWDEDRERVESQERMGAAVAYVTPGEGSLPELISHVSNLDRVSPARCPSHRSPFGFDAHGPRCAAGRPAPASRILAQVHRTGALGRTRIRRARRPREQGRDGRCHARRASPRRLGARWSRPKRGASPSLALPPSTMK
jgi:hypothetical protein